MEKHRRLATFTAAAAAAATALALLSWAVHKPTGDGDWTTAIADCNSSHEQMLLRETCLHQQWLTAATGGDLQAFTTSLAASVASEPDLELYCHGSGHNVGRDLLRGGRPVDELLAEAGGAGSLCDNGLLHGILENLDTVDTPDRFERAREGCVALLIYGEEVASDCGHGLGHGAQRSFTTFPDQYAQCAPFAAMTEVVNVRAACLGGALMNMFRDTEGQDIIVAFNDKDAVTSLVAACNYVTEVDPEMAGSCWFDAAEPFALNARRWVEDLNSAIDWAAAETAWHNATQACEQFPTSGRDQCKASLARHAGTVSRHEPAAHKRVCTWFTAELRNICIAEDS